MKKLTDFSFGIQLLAIPIAWLMMIGKILITVPIYVIAKCNDFIDKVS